MSITLILFYMSCFRFISLSWIVENNKHLKFYIKGYCDQWLKNGPCYNKNICSQLNGQNYEYFSKQDTRPGIK